MKIGWQTSFSFLLEDPQINFHQHSVLAFYIMRPWFKGCWGCQKHIFHSRELTFHKPLICALPKDLFKPLANWLAVPRAFSKEDISTNEKKYKKKEKGHAQKKGISPNTCDISLRHLLRFLVQQNTALFSTFRSSVLLCQRRDISTFLDILTVDTMKTIYFLNTYHLGW